MLSHLWFLGWVRLVKTRLRYQKIFALGFAWGNIFLVASMVLAILHMPRPKKSLQVKGLNPINSLQLFFSPDIGLQI